MLLLLNNHTTVFQLGLRTKETYIEKYGTMLATSGKNKYNNRKRKHYAKMRS